jgi:hypothetical protein
VIRVPFAAASVPPRPRANDCLSYIGTADAQLEKVGKSQAPLRRVRTRRFRFARRAFVIRQFEVDVFVAAGARPTVLRDGGIILAVRIGRDKLDEIFASDPVRRAKARVLRGGEVQAGKAGTGNQFADCGLGIRAKRREKRARGRRTHPQCINGAVA